MMGTYISKQDATIVELSGTLRSQNSQGETAPLKVGDTLLQNTVFSVAADATFKLQYSDGTIVTHADFNDSNEVTSSGFEATEVITETIDPEIAALQAMILSGEDPTESLPDTAAGETSPTGNEGGGFISVSRAGDETIADAGYNTDGFLLTQTAIIDEIPNFLEQFTLPTVATSSVTLFEKNLSEGSEPQISSLSQAESVSVTVQAGIDTLTINGVQVFVDGNFIGPVTIPSEHGSLVISSYDAINSILTYSYTLNSAIDHSESDILSELFLVQLTDSQGVTTTAVVTANVVDDAPSGLDDVNAINEDNLDGVLGNVLANDTLGADLAQVTQVSTTENSVDLAVENSIAGDYGSLTIAADGSYTYSLNNQSADIQALALGEQVFESFDYLLVDADGDEVSLTLVITITGTNDGPVIDFGNQTGEVIEAGVQPGGNTAKDGVIMVSGDFTAEDPDAGDTQMWSFTPTMTSEFGTFTINDAGEWQYLLKDSDADNSPVNQLAFGETKTEIYTVIVTDSQGATDTRTVTITIEGTNDIPVLSFEQGADSGMVKEAGVVDINDEGNTPVASISMVSGQFNADDVDTGDGETWTVEGTPNTDYGSFAVDGNGLWSYSLNDALADSLYEGQIIELTYTVRVTDNYGAYVDQDVTITIEGTNDIPVLSFEQGADSGMVKEAGVVDINDEGNTPVDGISMVSGQFNADDVDTGDGETWTVEGTPNTDYGSFAVDGNGLWSYSLNDALADSLYEGQIIELTYTVRVTDNYGAYVDQDVTITIEGTNDIPVLSFEQGADSGMVKEAGVVDINDEGNTPVDGINMVSGQFNADDVDTGDGETWTVEGTPNTDYGSFAVDGNGLWSYSLNDALADSLYEGQIIELTYTVRVTDNYGAYVDQDVTITIEGTNDIPVLSFEQGADSGMVKEAGVVDINDEGNTPVAGISMVSGQFNADDVDTGDGETWTVEGTPNTDYGSFAVDGNGLWTYNLNDALADSLYEGQTVELTYTVRVTDNYGAYVDQDVTITIEGTNDIPVLSFEQGADSGMVKEAGVVDINDEGNTPVAGTSMVSGQFNADDVDTGDGETWTVEGTPNTDYGSFAVDGNGLWSYSLNDALADSLYEGQIIELTYTVRVTDNYGAYVDQDVTITIEGTNDIPVLSFEQGADSGMVKEAGVVDINDEGNTPVAGISMVSGQFNADDVDTGDGETWTVEGTPNTDYGSFAVDGNGLWTYNLNDALADSLYEGQTVELTYTVRVTDNYGAYVDQDVTITIEGTNDIPVLSFEQGADSGMVKEAGVVDINDEGNTPVAGTSMVSGQFNADDVDTGDGETWTVEGTPNTDYGSFAVDGNGLWTYNLNDALADSLYEGQTVELTYTVRVTDNYGAYVDQDVTITIEGTNDIPVLSFEQGADSGMVKEAGVVDINDEGNTPVAGTSMVSGQFNADDVDTGDGETWTVEGTPNTDYGSFAVDGNGLWTYNLNDALADSLYEGQTVELTYTVRVTDNYGAYVDQDVTITIEGTNDIPVLTVDTSGGVTEDQDVVNQLISDTGALSFTDVDIGDTASVSSLYNSDITWSGGTLTNVLTQDQIDQLIAGFSADEDSWDFSISNELIQFLGVTESITLSFNVTVTDNNGAYDTEVVTITIDGVNDVIEGEFAKEIWVPAAMSQITDPYLSGYPLLVTKPSDVDVNDMLTITNLAFVLLTPNLDPDVELGSIYYMEDGGNTLTLIDFDNPPVLSASELETLVYVPGDNGEVDYQLDLSFTFTVNSGSDSVDGEFIIHSVPANSMASQTVQIGDGSSPLTSGNDQDADLVITEQFANAMNSDPQNGSLQLFTDFQKAPFDIPVPLNEQDENTPSGAARESEVSVRLTIGGAVFEVIPENDADGIITWTFDADTGLMKAEVDYSAIFLLDGNGDPTATSLADYIMANPLAANDIWTITYLDDNGGNFQARFVEAVFTHDQIADDSITIVGTDNINNLIFGSTNSDSLTGANLDDRIFGREGIDILKGLAGNDELIGGADNDDIEGGEGNDILIGGTGSDTLDGGIGRDYLSGGQGSDSLDGGALNGVDDGERDFFVWEVDSADDSIDNVYNFNNEIDVLDLSGLLVGEENGNLEDFFSFDFTDGNTTIFIDADGLGIGLDGVTIVLDGIDLSIVYGSNNEADIIAGLIADDALIVDPNGTFIPPYEQIEQGNIIP
ncbi:retention module-containing protein [Shewanella abyssi]|uniref:retention module-containing protein n=1 Tax=Shewanella abyssi TaxID=311789 RepID=UPI00200FDC95|nr:retention module-containing protein [Shewanella abyssi]MCL1050179.1 retention module-containing protein [Shewanella abyssi]